MRAAALLILLALAACGVKGDPVRPSQAAQTEQPAR
ncbi:MAG: LPS translocon maturation chaperone LptM [Rubrimonas sp.]